MKKKIALICSITILLALVVTSSLAYFMANDEVNNVVSFGSIKVKQHEQQHNDQDQLVDFIQGQYLYPIVNVSDPASDQYYVEKLVSIENEGSNEAYVRTFIAIPLVLKDIIHLDIDDSGKWLEDQHSYQSQTIDGISYHIISYTYHQPLNKNEITDYLLKGVYMDNKVDLQLNETVNQKQFCVLNNDNTYTYFDYDVNQPINVYVVTQASQVRGLSSNPQDAIDDAFGLNAPEFN